MNAEQVANAVWQARLDDELAAMTPPKFYDAIKPLDVDDDVAEEAWFIFHHRQQEVFA